MAGDHYDACPMSTIECECDEIDAEQEAAEEAEELAAAEALEAAGYDE